MADRTAVSEAYTSAASQFTGAIEWMQIDVDADHPDQPGRAAARRHGPAMAARARLVIAACAMTDGGATRDS